MDALIDLFVKIVTVVKEPVYLITIIGLIFVIWHQDRCISNELKSQSIPLGDEIKCINTITSKQVTLLEVLIFRGNKGE